MLQDPLVAILFQALCLSGADFINGFVHRLHDVEPIQHMNRAGDLLG